jgi:hypothetical protein
MGGAGERQVPAMQGKPFPTIAIIELMFFFCKGLAGQLEAFHKIRKSCDSHPRAGGFPLTHAKAGEEEDFVKTLEGNEFIQ